MRRVVWRALGGAMVIYLALYAGLWWLLNRTTLFETGWLETGSDLLGGLAAFLLSLLLFPAVVSMVLGLFLEDVVQAVEARHYPTLPPPRDQSALEAFGTTLRFAGTAVALNLLALPVYLIPVAGLVVFYLLNGYLLGREYFELVALRHLDASTAAVLRRTRIGAVWLSGVLITFLLSLPLVNLVMPVVAAAFMVHRFQALRGPSAAI